MIIAKAKRLTDALAKTDELGIARSETVVMFVHDGVEIYTLADNTKPRGLLNFLMSCFCL